MEKNGWVVYWGTLSLRHLTFALSHSEPLSPRRKVLIFCSILNYGCLSLFCLDPVQRSVGVKYTSFTMEARHTAKRTRPTAGMVKGFADSSMPTNGGHIKPPKLAPLIYLEVNSLLSLSFELANATPMGYIDASDKPIRALDKYNIKSTFELDTASKIIVDIVPNIMSIAIRRPGVARLNLEMKEASSLPMVKLPHKIETANAPSSIVFPVKYTYDANQLPKVCSIPAYEK